MLAILSGAEKNKNKKKRYKSNVYICNALANSDDRGQGNQFPSALHVNAI